MPKYPKTQLQLQLSMDRLMFESFKLFLAAGARRHSSLIPASCHVALGAVGGGADAQGQVANEQGGKGKAGPWGKETPWREGNHLLRLSCGISRGREEGLSRQAVLSEGMCCSRTRARRGIGAPQSLVIFSWAQLRPSSLFLQALAQAPGACCAQAVLIPQPPRGTPKRRGKARSCCYALFEQ